MAPVPKPERARAPHYFRAWRERAGLTQEQAIPKLGWSQSKISRLELGLTPFNQDDLETAAAVYHCSVVDLLMTDPQDVDNPWGVLVGVASAPKETRDQVLSFARFRLSETGRKQ